MIKPQIPPLMVGVDTQDIIEDPLKFKEQALSVHIVRVLPKFILNTTGMRCRAKTIATLLERIQSVHTPAQRAGAHRNLVDDYLSLHASDRQFVPESKQRFTFTAAPVTSAYFGDAFSLALYPMASQPEIYAKIQAEADALFDRGDPNGEEFTSGAIIRLLGRLSHTCENTPHSTPTTTRMPTQIIPSTGHIL